MTVRPELSRIHTLLIFDILSQHAMVTRTDDPTVRYVPIGHHEPDTVRMETVRTSPEGCPDSRRALAVPPGSAVRRAVACPLGSPTRATVVVMGPEGQARVSTRTIATTTAAAADPRT